MKLLKALSALLFIVLLIAIGFCACFCWHGWDSNQRYVKGWSDGYQYIKPIEDLQQQMGAEPDGIWGKETNRLYEQALCNQYSTWMFNSNVRKFDQKMLARIQK